MARELFDFLKDDGSISDSTGNIINDIGGDPTDLGGVGTNLGDGITNDNAGDPNDPNLAGPGGTGNTIEDYFNGSGDFSGLDQGTQDLLNSIGLGADGAGGNGNGGLSPSLMATLGQILQQGGSAAAAAVRGVVSSGGLSGLGQFLGSIGSSLAKNLIPAGMVAPFLAQAYQQYRDASKYADAGKAASQQADPFGQYRAGYAQKLQQSYDDPAAYLASDPTYNFLSKQGLSALSQTAAASGNLAYNTQGAPVGAYGKDMVDYSQGLASKTLNDERTQMAQLAGSQFNPATAASLAMQGTQQQIQSQNNAMANVGAALNAYRGNSAAPTTQPDLSPMPNLPDPGQINPMLPNPAGGQ